MSKLAIAPGLDWPITSITEVISWMGKRGGGKTYGAMKFAELLLDAKAQMVALDPIGKWYGLREPGTGKGGRGFDIPVFGGLYGDIPLTAKSGALVADVIVDRGISAVLDLSRLESVNQQTIFVLDFIKRFYSRKMEHPSPVHLFLEECQEFAPQKIPPQATQLSQLNHNVCRTAKLGRNFGIGMSLISQRPQAVDKEALSMTEIMLCFQMTEPAGKKAIKDWMVEKTDENEGTRENLLKRLAYLGTGEAMIWSPGLLGVNDVFKINPKLSADVSATPKIVKGKIVARPLRPIDISKLADAMKEVVEEADNENPAKLRAQIKTLEKDLLKAQSAKIAPGKNIPQKETITNTITKIVIPAEFYGGMEKIVAKFEETITNVKTLKGEAEALIRAACKADGKITIEKDTGGARTTVAFTPTPESAYNPPKPAPTQYNPPPRQRPAGNGSFPEGFTDNHRSGRCQRRKYCRSLKML